MNAAGPPIEGVRKPSRIALALIVLAPIVMALTGGIVVRSFEQRQALVEHTTEVIDTLNGFKEAINQAQILARDMIVLRQPRDPNKLELLLVIANSSAKRLETLLGDNSSQQILLSTIAPVLKSYTELIRRTPTEQPVVTQIVNMNGLVDEIMGLSQKCEAEERRLLATRLAERDQLRTSLSFAFVATVLLNVVSLAWGYIQQRRYLRSRDRAEQLIRETANELELRVQERTQQLESTVQQLRRSNADLENFAYSASHDLQEPLRIVGSYVTLLRRRYEGRLDNDATRYIYFAADGAKRMQDLINDLLSFSRVQRDSFRWAETPLDEPLQEALAYLKSGLEEAKATVIARPLPVATVDAVQIEKVFRGLISNSLKFAHPARQPELRISAEERETEWVISVADNGLGFEPEYAKQIFELFSRLHPRGRYPGTGTGLAIAQRVIELHGGRIWAETVLNSGTTVFFTLPHLDRLELMQNNA